MFGSKIRSWMENHIVRPRKKGNKNKNSTNNLNTQQHNGNQNGIKNTGFAIYHGDCTKTTSISNNIPNQVSPTTTTTTTSTAINNSISSPARRREVSPIQNHTTSRFGWQSPQNENPNSIKSDPFLSNNNNNQQISKNHKLQNTLLPPQAVNYNPLYQQHQYPITLQTDTQYNRRRNSSSSLSSQQQVVVELNYIEPRVIINKSDDDTFFQLNDRPQYSKEESVKSYKSLSPNINMFRSKKCTSPNKNENKKLQNNKSIFSSIKLSKPINDMNQNNNEQKYLPKILKQEQNNATYNSNQVQSNLQNLQNITNNNNNKNNFHQNQNYYSDDNNIKNVDEVRYGKILPTKHNTTTDYTTIGTYDNLNANDIIQYNTELLNSTYSHNNNNNCNNNNNNNNDKEITNNVKIQNYNNSNLINKSTIRNGCDPLTKIISNNHRSNNIIGSHMIRTTSGRLNGNNSILNSTNSNGLNQVNGNNTSNNGHPLANVINSLSSPESAYSTGYSTDGTSPGTTYTPPEYYINIRTGTHYFPKSVNTLAIEANRYKFGLNKIEEMSPQDPLPNNHRRTESYDFNQTKLSNFGIPEFYQNQEEKSQQIPQQQHQQNHQQQLSKQSPLLQRSSVNSIVPNFKGFESPSPRQRCRIRTNPWYSTLTEAASSGNSFLQKKIEIDAASSSSSGIKSSSDAGASDKNEKTEKTSDSESESSSTEIEVPLQQSNNKNNRTYSPGTIRRRNRAALAASAASFAAAVEASCKYSNIHNNNINDNHYHQATTTTTTQHLSLHQDNNSDEDATLNEMMGKFDESYVYEKETDILSSDSDLTDCPSDLDTGQDAGDECDTDELLDIDFIDNGSIQEISVDKSKLYKNTGNCSYYNFESGEQKKPAKVRRSRKHSEESNGRRKKKLLKTRKKSCELKEKNVSKYSRESRSLGGTPVSLRRRNQSMDGNKKIAKVSPLINRSNSLTFDEIHAMREQSSIALADSEKALLKADLEADVKYKQLIHEAESILVSMKSIGLKETPVASPRRICNPPANKRVEMLRNCEGDIKRELSKHHQPKIIDCIPIDGPQPIDSISLINKRLEQLRSETNTAPNSPNFGRLSPKKTHITNFINQNVAVTPEIPRRNNATQPPSDPRLSPKPKISQCSIKDSKKTNSSPVSVRRRFRSHSPRHPSIYSDSDTEEDLSRKSQKSFRSNTKSENEINGNVKIISPVKSSKTKHKQINKEKDINHNMKISDEINKLNINIIAGSENPKLMSFRSIDIGGTRRPDANYYCPQSEPLKRKIYKGSSTFERIKKSLDLESEIPKQAILERISNLRRSRQALKSTSSGINLSSTTNIQQNRQEIQNNDERQQLLYNTLEELKRNLEDQSVELNDLNENDSQ